MSRSFLKSTLLAITALITCLLLCPASFSQDNNSGASPKVYGIPVNPPPTPGANPNANPKPNTPSTNPTSPKNYDLSFEGKLKYGVNRAYLSWPVYLYPMIPTFRQQLNEREPPDKTSGDKAADIASRYGINFLTASNKAMLAYGIYPAFFKQNPHYIPSNKTGFGARTMYALKTVFVTQGDNGNSQFNASLFAGALSAAALANLYERSYYSPYTTAHHDRIGISPTFLRFASMMAYDALGRVFLKEFGPDIRHKF